MYVTLCYVIILDMFRAVPRSSSGGQIVQHLVSSLSVNGCIVHWLRADSVCSQPAYCTAVYRVTIPDAVIIQFDLLKMSMVLLETCREL